MEHHIPATWLPDPADTAERIAHLRETVTQETEQAQTTLAQGQRSKAALCYLSALEAQIEIARIGNTDIDRLDVAQRCWELTEFEDVGIAELTDRDLRDWAGNIWSEYFDESRLPLYREKAVMAGALTPDLIDYRVEENYLDRRIPELTELAVALEEYDILENDDGAIMFAIPILPRGDEKDAILFCDGGEHAILFKGPYRLIICDFLHPEIREKLTLREEILCIESQNPDMETGGYTARVVNRPKTSELATILLHRLKKL